MSPGTRAIFVLGFDGGEAWWCKPRCWQAWGQGVRALSNDFCDLDGVLHPIGAENLNRIQDAVLGGVEKTQPALVHAVVDGAGGMRVVRECVRMCGETEGRWLVCPNRDR